MTGLDKFRKELKTMTTTQLRKDLKGYAPTARQMAREELYRRGTTVSGKKTTKRGPNSANGTFFGF